AVDGVHGARLATAEQAALQRKLLGQLRHAKQRRVRRGDFAHDAVASAWMQATLCPASISRRGGCARRHSSVAKLQRGAKRQPGGGLISRGTTPAMVESRVLRTAAVSMRG